MPDLSCHHANPRVTDTRPAAAAQSTEPVSEQSDAPSSRRSKIRKAKQATQGRLCAAYLRVRELEEALCCTDHPAQATHSAGTFSFVVGGPLGDVLAKLCTLDSSIDHIRSAIKALDAKLSLLGQPTVPDICTPPTLAWCWHAPTQVSTDQHSSEQLFPHQDLYDPESPVEGSDVSYGTADDQHTMDQQDIAVPAELPSVFEMCCDALPAPATHIQQEDADPDEAKAKIDQGIHQAVQHVLGEEPPGFIDDVDPAFLATFRFLAAGLDMTVTSCPNFDDINATEDPPSTGGGGLEIYNFFQQKVG